MRSQYTLFLLLILLVLAPAVCAGPDDDLPEEMWLHADKTAAIAAAQLVAAHDPWTRAAMRLDAFDRDLWDEPPPYLDKVPPLSRARLALVRDDAPFAIFEQKLPEEIPKEALAEDAAYWQAILYSSRIPKEVFAQAARENNYLTYGHLYNEPAKYRGRVVHFEGRVARIKRLDPPAHAQRKGITAVYEASIFLDQPGIHPLVVIVPQLPPSLKPGDKLNQRVAFDGYFFKRYLYASGRLDEDKNNIPLKTVMLIGPTLTPIGSARAGTWMMSGSATILVWVFAFLGGVVLLVLGLGWWYRRSDRRVRSRLQALRGSLESPEAPLADMPLAEPTAQTNGEKR